ncbi:hypothetical protein BDZ91DRAFT_793968 [Kalaharituber pfeilii]|nr:hypothetical protein BDZ91DRAFT_793968 [Kalaharituber pfeilii]
MSYRGGGGGITGTNNVPLGTRRRFGGTDGEVSSALSNADTSPPVEKRGRSPVRADSNEPRKRKKKNRWGEQTENKAAGLMGLPTAIYANMTSEQLEAYTLHLRIEEISQKIRINDVVPADGDRSPSPPPQYDNFGRRVNTREYRYKKRLEDERHKLIERALKVIPNYHPPSDYKRPTKTQEKIYVPVNDYPELNFIGLLIGPRGHTLKKMEQESGAKIAIRGKGSVKEGKGRSDAAHTSNQEEDLHCLIMADTEEKVNKAKKLINHIIETAASIPEGQNELKRNQLRELAALNGTLRDDENQACQNCGQIGHRKYDCPEQRNFTANIICRCCGHAGHMARDCTERPRGASWRNDDRRGKPGSVGSGDAVDREYEQLMQELSGGAPSTIGGGAAPRAIESGPGGSYGDNRGQGGYGGRNYDNDNGNDRNLKPWQRGPTGGPAPWQRSRDDRGPPRDAPTGPSGSGAGLPLGSSRALVPAHRARHGSNSPIMHQLIILPMPLQTLGARSPRTAFAAKHNEHVLWSARNGCSTRYVWIWNGCIRYSTTPWGIASTAAPSTRQCSATTTTRATTTTTTPSSAPPPPPPPGGAPPPPPPGPPPSKYY